MRLRVLLEKRVSALTLLQEKRVSALTVNSMRAKPKAAKTKIERLRLSAISRRNLDPHMERSKGRSMYQWAFPLFCH